MQCALTFYGLLFGLCIAHVQAQQVVPLFPNGAPGAKGTSDNDIPALTVYRPEAGKATGTGIVFCPGGGYSQLSFNTERQNVLKWLVEKGMTVYYLRYRHGGNGYHYPAPMQDVQRALRWVRHRATDYQLDAAKIGIIGFSAGGHLAAWASTRFDEGNPTAPDPVDRQTSRPSFAVLFYPVINLTDPALAHLGSRRHLIGPNPDSLKLAVELSAEQTIAPTTLPTLIFYGGNDTTTPPANGAVHYLALKKAGVPVELHLFERGRHAFGMPTHEPLLSSWPQLLDTWLRAQSVIR